jgi:hypothetical protein
MWPYTNDELKTMFETKTLILKGKRWRKFHEFIWWAILIGLGPFLGGILRITKIGFREWQVFPFIVIPILFMIWWIPYKRKELKLYEILTSFKKKQNQEFVLAAIEKLGWHTKYNSQQFIEAYDNSRIGLTWGMNMISVLIEDNRILLNCLTNLDSTTTHKQAFFTFGKLKRNVKKLERSVLYEISKSEGQRLAI